MSDPRTATAAAQEAAGTPLHRSDYLSTRTRAPLRPPVPLRHGPTELTGPLLGEGRVRVER
jgi:protocatechuate 3,4-dioxygenase beta subunit